MKPFQLPLVALALACAVPAQEGPLRFVPKDAMFVAQMDAPTGWPETFAETRLGAFLDGPVVQDAIAPLREEIEAALEEVRAEGRAENVDLLDAMLAFEGRVTVAFDVDLSQGGFDAEPRFYGLVALSGGADGELDELASLVERSIELESDDAGHVMIDQVFGDETLRIVETVDDRASTWVSVPQLIDDEFVMFLWTGESGRIEDWAQLDEGERYDPSKIPQQPLAVRVSLEQMMTAIVESEELQLMGFDTVLSHFGLAQLRAFDVSVGIEDEFVACDFGVAWEGDGGVFEMLVPETQGSPRLLELAPTNAPAWSVSVFRLDVLYDVVAAIWDDMSEMIPVTREDGEAMFEEMFRVRLREDLFDHLGGETLAVTDSSSFEGADIDDPMYAMAGQGYALELKNPTAFAESLETMLRARGMHAARKTTDYRGFDVHRLRLAGMIQLDYAITDRVLAFSLNSEDPALLRSILDEELARRAGEPPAPLSDDASRRLELMADGWCGASVTDAGLLFDAFRFALEQTLAEEGWDEIPEELSDLLDVMGSLRAAIRTEGLSTIVSATWARPGSLRARMLW